MSRRFQFSLKAILAIVTMAAVVAWAIQLTDPVAAVGALICYGPICLFLARRGVRSFHALRREAK
jgi:uncharacterized membrane protein